MDPSGHFVLSGFPWLFAGLRALAAFLLQWFRMHRVVYSTTASLHTLLAMSALIGYRSSNIC